MKLVVLKLLSLLVLAAGIAALGIAFNRPEITGPLTQAQTFLTGDAAGFHWKLLVAGAIFCVLGGYGFLPQLRGAKRTLTYAGEHGEINIRIDQAESTLRKVITGMPEVKSVKVRVLPDKEFRRAVIKADVIVINQDDAPARHTYELITALIRETATDVLGLEIEQPIQLHVSGTKVNPRAASEALHARVKQRNADAGAWVAGAATASAIPAAAGIMPEVPARSENDYSVVTHAVADAYTPAAIESMEVGVGPVAAKVVEAKLESPEVEIVLEAPPGDDLALQEESPLELLVNTQLPDLADDAANIGVDAASLAGTDDFRLPPLTSDEEDAATADEPGETDEPKKDSWS